MPPANDNFANATVLNGASGQMLANNIAATNQTGEPANNGKTVWFKFTSATTRTVSFSTLFNSALGTLTQPLRTILRVYTGTTVSALTEVTYVNLPTWNQNYSSWDFGSLVAFVANQGTDYFVRVDGVRGAPTCRPVERSRTANVATLKCIAHGYSTGLVVSTSGLGGAGYNLSSVTITKIDADHFTFPSPGDDEALTADTRGIITPDTFTLEGNFHLTWGDYIPLRLGACDACPPSVGLGYECRGTVQGTVMTTNFNLSFGNQPKARYVVRYCGGAFKFRFSTLPPEWTVDFSREPTANPGPYWHVHYQGSGGAVTDPFTNLPLPAAFNSQAQCETAYRCMQAAFNHEGGNVSLDFFDAILQDNANGSPNPTFGLYRLTPVFRAASACASWVVKGTSATCTFTVQNLSDIDWNTITATLQASGGITSPSAAIPNVGIGANGSINLTFTFNAATPNVTGTIILSSPYFPSSVSLSWFLGPILTTATIGEPIGPGGCNGKKWGYNVTVLNTGYWTISPTANLSIDNGLQLLTAACARGSSVAVGGGFLLCVTGTGGPQVDILAPAVATAGTLTLTFTDTGYTSTAFTLGVNVPS